MIQKRKYYFQKKRWMKKKYENTNLVFLCFFCLILAGSSFTYDSQTAPYPFETMSKWMNLTNHITDSLFNQLTNTSSISFILDKDSDHLYNYTTTINITEIIKPTRDSSLYLLDDLFIVVILLPILLNYMLIQVMSF